MTVPLSLIRRQNHAAALSAVGIVNDTRFPTITQCPKCAKTALRVFADEPADGLWLACDACKTAGNIVTFAAQVWNIGVIEAIKQFASLGLTAAEDASRWSAIENKNFDKTVAAADFWNTAKHQTWGHDNDIILSKLKELQIEQDLPGMDDLIGVAEWAQVVKLYEEFGAEQPKRWRRGSPCLVFKFSDLPDRISGFLLMQYNDEFQARHMFVPTHGYRKNNKAEAGYYLLQNAFLQNADLHNCVFVIDDVFWVLNAQIIQIKYGLPTLPICASYHNQKITSTGRNWLSFPYAPRFFYSETAPAEAISQACLSRGYACLPIEKSVYPALGKPLRTLSKLANIRRHGESWKSALEKLIDGVTVLQARAIGQRMAIPHDKIRAFCDAYKVPAQIADQLLVESLNTPTGQLAAKQCVLEKDGCWIAGNGRHIADGIIRITDVFQHDNGEQTYRGYAQINNQRIDFTETAKIVERMGLLAYVRYKAGQRGLLFVFDKQWNSRALMVAMKLDRPRFVQISDKIGWSDETADFRFPNYTITNAGEVIPCEHIGDKQKSFPEPTVVAPQSITAALTPSHENGALWAGIATIVSNIVAPIGNKSFVSTAVTSQAYLDTLAKIGLQLNCQHKKLMGLSGVIKIANTATWPYVIDAPYDRKRLIDTVVRHQQAPIVLKTYYATAIAATTYGWNALHTTELIPPIALDFLPYLLPSYVQHVLRKRMTLATRSNFALAVLKDLHTWLKENYGATFNCDSAENNLWTPERVPELIMAFIADEIQAGDLDVLPRPRKKEQAQNYVLKNDKYWWINEYFLTRKFTEKCGLAPNWLFVQNALDTLRVFLGQNTIHHMAGFNVNAEWANSFVFRENRKIG